VDISDSVDFFHVMLDDIVDARQHSNSTVVPESESGLHRLVDICVLLDRLGLLRIRERFNIGAFGNQTGHYSAQKND
jgi:hypothetical protein